ncbi:NADPH-dependent FMN reductase [Roseovarius sp. B08]|uniref:NADPH-dependent FMN reductase n=1 Tax=Roseovarius sp. B08 TaxID=3449223 RepID=UPI003EDC9085
MTKDLNIATISGSLRKGSLSTSVADSLQELVPDGVTVTRHDIADIPLYNEDIKDGDTSPLPVRDLAEKLAAADAIVVVSPEYNRGTSGVLKNVIDWMSKEPNAPFSGKPTLIITQSPGATAGLTAHYNLRQVLSVINADVQSGFEIAIGGAAGKIENGKLTDDNTREFIAKQLKRLAKTAAG